MKRAHVIARPMRVSDMTFQDLYDEISENWQTKAERLQARRRRAMRRAYRRRDTSRM